MLQAERCTPESTAGRSLLTRGKGRSVRAPVPSAEGLARSREEEQSRWGRETPQSGVENGPNMLGNSVQGMKYYLVSGAQRCPDRRTGKET